MNLVRIPKDKDATVQLAPGYDFRAKGNQGQVKMSPRIAAVNREMLQLSKEKIL